MYETDTFFSSIEAGFISTQFKEQDLFAMLAMVTVLAIFEFFVYRFTSRRGFYSKQFNIVLAIIPYFIATVIMVLQSNIVITLGTIGALAILRFRTAIKEPLDMLFLLWSVHTGIVCGAGLYEIAVITSLVVTVVALLLAFIPVRRSPFLLVVNMQSIDSESGVMGAVKKYSGFCRVKSRNVSQSGADIVVEINTKNEQALIKEIEAIEGVTNIAIVCNNSENIV